MSSSPAAVAAAAQHALEERLRTVGVTQMSSTRSGEGWFAVRTGVADNELNAVVSEVGADLPAPLVADLVDWFGAVPASWFTAGADPGLTRTLMALGARPERTGSWSGGVVDEIVEKTGQPPRPGLEVVRITTAPQLDVWLELAARCGWIETPAEGEARRRLHLAVGLEHPALTHWLALDRGRPVGFASAQLDGSAVDLWNLGVLAEDRRRGVGRSLVRARLVHAASRGATLAVSAPSPDGWRLQESLGFSSVPVVPDTCFYLPGGS